MGCGPQPGGAGGGVAGSGVVRLRGKGTAVETAVTDKFCGCVVTGLWIAASEGAFVAGALRFTSHHTWTCDAR